MRKLLFVLTCFAGMQAMPAAAAVVEATINLSEQRMYVYKNGYMLHSWAVSTARRGKVTPVGSWTAKWTSRYHRSSRYHNAPMPFSIFFNGNYAVHGTDQVKRLGSPASAGCIRLHPDNARVLYNMALEAGLKNTLIRVVR